MSIQPLNKSDSAHHEKNRNGHSAILHHLAQSPERESENSDIPNTDDTPTVLSKNKPSSEVDTAITPSLDSLQGRTLAHFELMAPIGVGGMAAVLLARDKQLDRIVALKILPPDMAKEPEMVQRFHQEARAAAKLDHENIARVFYCGEDQGLHFIAFEFVEGDNLRSILEQQGPLPVEQAVKFMLQVATGLAHAARRGVVHRDIKPSNIVITPLGRAKLVDMGLARTAEIRSSGDLTQSGVTLGTFEYISPEQALEPRLADVRSDIYSLGCTFYHMLTGQPPVPEGTAAKKLHHHQHVAPVDPRQINPDIPDSVAAILSKMMAKDPKERYQTAEHLVQHLLVVAGQLSVSDSDVTLAELDQGQFPLPTPPKRNPALLIGLALVGLVVAVIVLSFAPTGPQPTDTSIHVPIHHTGSTVGDKQAEKTPTLPNPATSAPSKQRAESFIEVKDEESLRKTLESPRGVVSIRLENDITLTKGGLLFKSRLREFGDRALVLESADPLHPRTITLHVPENLANPLSLLCIQGGPVEIKDIRFCLKSSERTPSVPVALVKVEDGGSLKAFGCHFTQDDVPRLAYLGANKDDAKIRNLMPMASVLLHYRPESGWKKPTTAAFEECWFARGQVAVAVDGMANIQQMKNCAFGPHSADFHLYGSGDGLQTELNLDHCSALVVYGPVLRIDENVKCLLNVKHSIFSAPDVQTYTERDRRFFIHQRDSKDPLISYQGKQNCFHNLEDFWNYPGGLPVSWSDFQEKPFYHEAAPSTYLSKKRKLFAFINPLSYLADDPQLAFEVNPGLEVVRELDGTPERRHPLGVVRFAGKYLYKDGLLPPLPSPLNIAAAEGDRDKKIVDGKGDGQGRFKTLGAAILEAADNDVIWIRMENLAVNSIELDPTKNITIKPYPDFHPVLTLSKKAQKREAALFNLMGGKITFENLIFTLKADREFKSQSIVTMMAGGQCRFKDCRITLQSLFNTRLYVFSFPSAAKKNMREKRILTLPPFIEMEYCVVRGKGNLLSLQQATPFQFTATQSLIGLDGSFLFVDGNLAQPAMDDKVVLRLNRVTTYLSEYFIHLLQEKGKGQIPVNVQPTNCLFITATSPEDQPSLIYLEGMQARADADKLVPWTGQNNAYCGYRTIVNGQFADSAKAFRPKSIDNWYNNDMKQSGDGSPSMPRLVLDPLESFPRFSNLTPAYLQDKLQKVRPQQNDEESLSEYGAKLSVLQNHLFAPTSAAVQAGSFTPPAVAPRYDE